ASCARRSATTRASRASSKRSTPSASTATAYLPLLEALQQVHALDDAIAVLRSWAPTLAATASRSAFGRRSRGAARRASTAPPDIRVRPTTWPGGHSAGPRAWAGRLSTVPSYRRYGGRRPCAIGRYVNFGL